MAYHMRNNINIDDIRPIWYATIYVEYNINTRPNCHIDINLCQFTTTGWGFFVLSAVKCYKKLYNFVSQIIIFTPLQMLRTLESTRKTL